MADLSTHEPLLRRRHGNGGKVLHVDIIGAGVVGLACATELLARGATVTVHERGAFAGAEACSWHAGGMLAPWCEGESAEEPVIRLGTEAADWWETHTDCMVRNGTLVLASSRDRSELKRFAQRTSHYAEIDGAGIGALEPDLAGRFSKALFFAEEAHLDPRQALASLAKGVIAAGGKIRFSTEVRAADLSADWVLDCRGLSARDELAELRGVKGEMLLLRSRDLQLNRPIRLLHPRIPLYVVPRAEGIFMVGATMIESADRKRISARSMLELLGGAYALHPAFGEAEVVEIGVDARPAFPDNLPRLTRRGRVIHVNGLFRHGFLLSPAMARMVAEAVFDPTRTLEALHEAAA